MKTIIGFIFTLFTITIQIVITGALFLVSLIVCFVCIDALKQMYQVKGQSVRALFGMNPVRRYR